MKDSEVARVMKELCAPFPFEELEILTQSVSNGRAMAVPYYNARAVMNRLDSVLGHENWRGDVTPIQGGFLYTLTVTINGHTIVRTDGSDCTTIEAIKGGISSALKRAFSAMGNRTLYEVEFGWLDAVTEERTGKHRFKRWEPASLKAMRVMYESTLKRLGKDIAPIVVAPVDDGLPTIEECKDFIKDVFGESWVELKTVVEGKLGAPLTSEKIRIACQVLMEHENWTLGDVPFAKELLARL